MTTFYLDPVNGDDADDGSDWANAWKTTKDGATEARIAPGDTIRIAKSSAPTSVGTCTFTHDSPTITIPANIVAKVDDGENNWTQSSNVTCTRGSVYKVEGSYAIKHAIGASFTTGKASYYNTATLNLSGYEQLSFWIRSSVDTTAGYLQLCLCSDDAGATPVDTFDVPALKTNIWTPVTVDKGSALGSAIESVALYVATDFGAVDVYTDYIMACKDSSAADSLTLTSLISDHNTQAPPYYPIQKIDGTTLTLGPVGDLDTMTGSLDYVGTSGDKTAYKIEPIQVLKGANSPIYATEDGAASSWITYSGGWNTSSNEQDGYTWWRCRGDIAGIYLQEDYISVERCCMADTSSGAYITTTVAVSLSDLQVTRTRSIGIYPYTTTVGSIQLADVYIISAAYAAIGSLSYPWGLLVADGYTVLGANQEGLFLSETIGDLRNVFIRQAGLLNSKYGVNVQQTYARFHNLTVEANGTYNDVYVGPGGAADFFNAVITDYTIASYGTVRFIKLGGTADNHLIYINRYDTMEDEASVRHTASGISWKCTIGASTISNAVFPTRFPIAQIPCAASAEVTVTAYLRRTNTGLTCGLECRGGQIGNVDSDVQDPMTAEADTWEQLTVQFTPNEAGVVEIDVYAYGGNYSVYVDDVTIAQA